MDKKDIKNYRSIISKLDYSIELPKERTDLVNIILEDNLEIIYSFSEDKQRILFEIMVNYIIEADIRMEKKERSIKVKDVLTPYKEKKIAEKEESIQALNEKNESNKEIDNLYNIKKNNIITTIEQDIENKKIDYKDLKDIPFITQINETIAQLRISLNNSVLSKKNGKNILHIIQELEQDKTYIINFYLGKVKLQVSSFGQTRGQIDFESDTGYLDENNDYRVVSNNYLDFTNPEVWCQLIKFYSRLKESSYSKIAGNMKFIIMLFEDIIDTNFKYNYPLFFDMIVWKIDGFSAEEIRKLVNSKYATRCNVNYVTNSLTKVIPTILANEYKRSWIIFKFKNIPYLSNKWKLCTFCGKIKPRSPFFWSRNSNPEGYYSKCKECRNSYGKERKRQLKLKKKENFDEATVIDNIIINRELKKISKFKKME